MLFDVRLPIGFLFLAIGLLVGGYGLSTPILSAGVNIDLVWGAVMAVFGAVMLLLAVLAKRARLDPPSED
jgi:hypothetical protein